MTTDHVLIGGVERPFHFSNKAARQYELTTGRKYTADLLRLFEEISGIATAMQGDNNAAIASEISISLWSDFAYAGFAYAYRKAGRSLEFDVDDLAAWMLEDSNATQTICSIILQSVTGLDMDAEDSDSSKKKT